MFVTIARVSTGRGEKIIIRHKQATFIYWNSYKETDIFVHVHVKMKIQNVFKFGCLWSVNKANVSHYYKALIINTASISVAVSRDSGVKSSQKVHKCSSYTRV